jgi:hypothetical protein
MASDLPGVAALTRPEDLLLAVPLPQVSLPSGPILRQEAPTQPEAPVRVVDRLLFPLAPPLAWDALQRAVYALEGKLLQRQALELFERGQLTTAAEVEHWLRQRDLLRTFTQSQLSPVGKAFSEWMDRVVPPAERLARKAAALTQNGRPPESETLFRAVLGSLGRTSWKANAVGFGVGVAAAVQLYFEVEFVSQAVAAAPPANRWRVRLRESTGAAVAAGTGYVGWKAGCATGATATVWYFGAGGLAGCIAGALLGGSIAGYVGREAGRNAADLLYDTGEAVWQLLP